MCSRPRLGLGGLVLALAVSGLVLVLGHVLPGFGLGVPLSLGPLPVFDVLGPLLGPVLPGLGLCVVGIGVLLGLGCDLVLVELEAVLAKLEVAAGSAVSLDPASGLGLEVVLAVLEVAPRPGVGLDPPCGLGLSRDLVLVEL